MLVVGMGVAMAIVAVLGIFGLRHTSEEYSSIMKNDAQTTERVRMLDAIFNQSSLSVMGVMVNPNGPNRNKYLGILNENIQAADEILNQLEQWAEVNGEKESFMQMKKKVDAYRNNRAVRVQAAQSGTSNLNMMAAEVTEVQGATEAVRQFSDVTYKTVVGKGKQIEDEIATISYVMTALSILVIVIAIAAGLMIANTLTDRMRRLKEAADNIVRGDLTHAITVPIHDELGAVSLTFEEMRQNMHKAISEINMAAGQVAGGAKNVSDASVSLSQGAAEQASSVEELSSSITEVASHTSNNAASANKANDLTAEAKKFAEVGNGAMDEMLSAMEAINASSTNISKIIKVIDEIAFQTNILALNAAVEAARAGSHGKGFAVVAEEVRNLAARSAKAAKETTDMIEDSINKVNGGREIAHKTAEALKEIVSHVSDVADLVGTIAQASNEQNVALEQINLGIQQVSQVVQSNSATSEEAASASEQLSAQADLMRQTVHKFRLGSVRESAPVSAPPQSPRPSKPRKIALTEDEGFGKY
jgi:methyl-accepting chemotaxis protein